MSSKRIQALTPFLDALVEEHHHTSVIREDPLQFPRRYRRRDDREVVALLAACMAWGRVAQIASVMERLLKRLGKSPSATLRESGIRDLRKMTDGIVHRVLTSDDIAVALSWIGAAQREHGSLERLFKKGWSKDDETVIPALTHFASHLRNDTDRRGLKHLFPDPKAGSACKRWLLFLRWVVRPSDGVDLGLWRGIPASQLVIPLDTHIHRIAQNLRLTERNDASLRTALEVTEALRQWRPEDPVGCDFALTRLGIHQICPSRVDREICADCGLRAVCRRGVQGSP